MCKIKSLVLGSAAAIVAIGGAQAADLPVKAKAVEYVKVCSLYGAGFYYIPGTDTCIRIGGYLRAEVTFGGAPSDATYLNGDGGLGLRTAGEYQSRARIMMYVDTRTATEYGVVRTFGAFGPQFTFGATNAGTDVPANGGMRVEAAFIQFAGFTFGRSASAYALPWNGSPGNINSTLMGGPNYDAGVNNIQYTWQFGNGVSASVGIDTQEAANRVGVLSTSLSNASILGAYTNHYAAPTAPDVVGNIRLDQAWGLLQFSAAAHEVTGDYYTASALAGHPSDKWGFAVTGALQLKNLPTGPGDDIKISGTYTEGALRYVLGQSGATPTNFQVLNGGGFTFAGVPIADGVYGGLGTSIELTKAYGFNGAFNHNWNQNWSSSVFGSWTHVDYNGVASTAICAGTYGARTVAGTCNPDFNVSQLGLSTTWKPVKNLAFIAEASWVHIDQNNTGASTLTGTSAASGRVVNWGDTNSYSGILRVQRNF
ncbi:Porin omp2b precursor [Afipia felis]|uniref:Porin n=1 Tax=Afipia felis TaxID=1035 RepID=A0A090N705_AFIFE|nr:porin [Afipia felis]CEG07763.1 Porin omp2b precursor [Afipia felis]